MSAGTPAERRGKLSLVIPSIPLTENLNAQRRKLLRVQTVIEDAASGEDSTLVPRRSDGTIDQIKLAAVLDSAALMLREVITALDGVVAKQMTDTGQAAP